MPTLNFAPIRPVVWILPTAPENSALVATSRGIPRICSRFVGADAAGSAESHCLRPVDSGGCAAESADLLPHNSQDVVRSIRLRQPPHVVRQLFPDASVTQAEAEHVGKPARTVGSAFLHDHSSVL